MKLNNLVSVRLENFQSHLDTTIHFDVGLNVIVGQSDSGKTGVLRGIRWALFNQPRGTDFLRVGADFVRVTVVLDTGATIVRERTSSKNRYIIKKTDSEDLVLEGFGSQVPEEVIQAHHMRSFRIDSDHEWQLQIAQQLDGPFLLEQTGSLRAKTIGRMSGAHYLDMAIRDTSKDVYGLSQRTKQKEIEVKEANEALIPFESLDHAKIKLDQAFATLEKAKKSQLKLSALKEWGDRSTQLRVEENKVRSKLQLVERVHEWEIRYEQARQLATKQTMLNKLSEQWNRLVKDSLTCEKWLDKTKEMKRVELLYEHVRSQTARWQQTERAQEQQSSVHKQTLQLQQAMEQTTFLREIDTERIRYLKAKQERRLALNRLAKQLKQVEGAAEGAEKQASKMAHMEQAATLLNQTTELTRRHEEIVSRVEALKEVEKRLADGRNFIQDNHRKEKQLEKHYQSELTALGICPTCGQAIHSGEESH